MRGAFQKNSNCGSLIVVRVTDFAYCYESDGAKMIDGPMTRAVQDKFEISSK